MSTPSNFRIVPIACFIAAVFGMISLSASAVPELHPRTFSGVKAYSNMKEKSGVEAYSKVTDFTGVEAYEAAAANNAANIAATNAQIDWPDDSISYSDMNKIFQKVPPITPASSYNIQFPNTSNWDVTPEKANALLSNYTQVSQAAGLTGKIPSLMFSSLGINKMTAGMGTFSIYNLDGAKSVMKMAVDQFRYAQLNLGDEWPDWMKRLFVALYDSMMMAIDFMFDTLSVVASGNISAAQGQMQTATDQTQESSTQGNGMLNNVFSGR